MWLQKVYAISTLWYMKDFKLIFEIQLVGATFLMETDFVAAFSGQSHGRKKGA